MTDVNLPNTLTLSGKEENDEPWGRLIPCLSNLDTVDIYKDHFKIGRSTSCDIHIDESRIAVNIFNNISKEHFVLIKDPNVNKLYIKDLSKNGTFLNGTRINKRENVIIRDNDKIAIGQKNVCAFIFRSLLIETLPDTPVDISNSPNEVPVVVRPTWGRLLPCLLYLDSFDLSKPTFKIGRSSQCDVSIDETNINPHIKQKFSKEHFLIVKDPDSHITFITDLSKLGTFLNGRFIGKNQRCILQNDDTIGIGPKNIQVYVYKSMYSLEVHFLPPELRKNYELSALLGKGGCGEVRLAFEKYSCKMYAIKKIIKGRSSASQMHLLNHPSKIKTEINILQNLSCPFVINMKEIIETADEVFIVLDYMKGGELNNRILSRQPMTEANIKFLFYQMVLAVNFLHLNGIAHRDLKPENVLLSSDDVEPLIKISDFGLSKVIDGSDMMRTMCGTWQYIAPEVLDNHIPEYDKQVDVWSLGVILFYMLSRRLPFNSSDKELLRKLILNGIYIMDDPSWDNVTHLAKSLVKKMLTVDPRKRITVEGILDHPWLANDTQIKYRVKSLIQANTPAGSDELTTSDESTSEKQRVKRIRLTSSDDSDECQLGTS